MALPKDTTPFLLGAGTGAGVLFFAKKSNRDKVTGFVKSKLKRKKK